MVFGHPEHVSSHGACLFNISKPILQNLWKTSLFFYIYIWFHYYIYTSLHVKYRQKKYTIARYQYTKKYLGV